MSALLWHAEAAEHLAVALDKEADEISRADPAAARILFAMSRAHHRASISMREQLRAQAQGKA